MAEPERRNAEENANPQARQVRDQLAEQRRPAEGSELKRRQERAKSLRSKNRARARR